MNSKKSKWKLGPEEICRQYYESQIFYEPQIFDISTQNEASTHFFAEASITIGCLDSTFKDIDDVTFFREVFAINIELFGLAWLNYNYELCQQYSEPELLLAGEINATKTYLKNRGNENIWNIMQVYNDVISQSFVEETAFENWERLRDFPIANNFTVESHRNERIKQLESGFKLFEKSTDSECNARLSVRFAFVPYNTYRITRLFQNLSLTLTNRIGWAPTQVGLFAVQRFIAGLHQNAVHYLDAVYDCGSYVEAMKVRNKQISALKKIAQNYMPREQNK